MDPLNKISIITSKSGVTPFLDTQKKLKLSLFYYAMYDAPWND